MAEKRIVKGQGAGIFRPWAVAPQAAWPHPVRGKRLTDAEAPARLLVS